MPYANNRSADQSAHLCSLISAFVVHCLDNIIPIPAKSKIFRLKLASEAEQASLSLTLSQTPKTGFLVTWLIFHGPALAWCSKGVIFHPFICPLTYNLSSVILSAGEGTM